MGDKVTKIAGHDLVEGDQTNITTVIQPPQSQEEFKAILNDLQTRLEALKQTSLTAPQKQMVEAAEKKVAEAAEEAAKQKPLGERIKTTLKEAQEYLEAIGGSLAAAAALGTTIGTLLLGVAKLFGL
jgi:chromosome segregation ATPase